MKEKKSVHIPGMVFAKKEGKKNPKNPCRSHIICHVDTQL